MADIVYINQGNRTGAELLHALNQIREGLSTLRRLDGLRVHSIAAGPEVMQANFGVKTPEQAQALSDRMAAMIAWLNGTPPEWMANAQIASIAAMDFINAITYEP